MIFSFVSLSLSLSFPLTSPLSFPLSLSSFLSVSHICVLFLHLITFPKVHKVKVKHYLLFMFSPPKISWVILGIKYICLHLIPVFYLIRPSSKQIICFNFCKENSVLPIVFYVPWLFLSYFLRLFIYLFLSSFSSCVFVFLSFLFHSCFLYFEIPFSLNILISLSSDPFT